MTLEQRRSTEFLSHLHKLTKKVQITKPDQILALLDEIRGLKVRHQDQWGQTHKEECRVLFLALRHLIMPYLASTPLLGLRVLDIAGLLLSLKLILGTHKNHPTVQKSIRAKYAQASDSLEKFLHVTNEFIWEIFNDNSTESKKRYLHTIIHLPLAEIFNFYDDMISFSHSLKLIYPDTAEIIDLYNGSVFDNEYWTMDLSSQKTILTWFVPFLWNVYGCAAAFLKLCPLFKNLFFESLKRSQLDLAFSLHFTLTQVYFNLKTKQEDWKLLMDEVEKPLSSYFQRQVISGQVSSSPVESIKNLNRPKIGFVFDRLAHNSVYRAITSLFMGMIELGYPSSDICIYDFDHLAMGQSNPQCIEMLKKLNIRHVSCWHLLEKPHSIIHDRPFRNIEKLRQKIIDDGIEILIMFDGYAEYNYLFSTRSAPLQIFFSHGNYIYNLPAGIDGRVTMGGDEDVQKTTYFGNSYYTYKNCIAPLWMNPSVNNDIVQQFKTQFAPDTIFLGSIGRLFKSVNEDYLRIIIKLLHDFPQTVYLACGEGDNESIRTIIHSLNEDFRIKDLDGRFRFIGVVDAHLFGNIIDIFLNSFPHSHGASLLEFMAKGRPVISMKLEDWGEINKTIPETCSATSSQEYVGLASACLADRSTYQRLAEDCQKMAQNFSDVKKSGQTFLTALSLIIKDHSERVCV